MSSRAVRPKIRLWTADPVPDLASGASAKPTSARGSEKNAAPQPAPTSAPTLPSPGRPNATRPLAPPATLEKPAAAPEKTAKSAPNPVPGRMNQDPPRKPQKQKPKPVGLSHILVHHRLDVEVTLQNQITLSGRLVRHSQFELMLEAEDRSYILPKHSVMTMEFEGLHPKVQAPPPEVVVWQDLSTSLWHLKIPTKIVLMSGKTLSGLLVRRAQYEFWLRTEDGRMFLVPKHSVLFYEFAGFPEEAAEECPGDGS